MKKGIVIILSLCCFQSMMAQSHNRRVVIEMLLGRPHHHMVKFATAASGHSELLLNNAVPSDLRFSDPIPKYTLPKCSIVCRLEEYVQLHTPMKLNIGLAGQ